jgi:hypothetical protein
MCTWKAAKWFPTFLLVPMLQLLLKLAFKAIFIGCHRRNESVLSSQSLASSGVAFLLKSQLLKLITINGNIGTASVNAGSCLEICP